MTSSTPIAKNQEPVFWLDESPVTGNELVSLLLKQRALPSLIRELIMDRTVSSIELAKTRENELLEEFKVNNNLISEESLASFLQSKQITKTLLMESLSRPEKIFQYRNDRWGPRVNSLYLKHKEKYDIITYRRLQSQSPDIMQEVFFRIKDKEVSWENMAIQFYRSETDAVSHLKTVAANEIEPDLLNVLRQNGVGVVNLPIQLSDGVVVVSELLNITASPLNDELRTEILRQEFDSWLNNECTKMLGLLRIPS